MSNFRIPTEINVDDILSQNASWSPGMYRRVIIPTSSTKTLSSLLDAQKPFDKGVEPGSMWYVRNSPCKFVRTKALQTNSNLLYPKGKAIVPINPRVYEDPNLDDGDILMSKDSNVGECAMIDGHDWKNHMFSGGIVRLRPTCDRYYLFSFLKHHLFKEQLIAKLARGATITHSRTVWLDNLVPFPNQIDDSRVIYYISALMKAIIEKEVDIRKRNRLIDETIHLELVSKQNAGKVFAYHFPIYDEVRQLGRLDTGMYTADFKSKQFLITNYEKGYASYEELGFDIGRGQNLQVSCIGKPIYSDEYRQGFYRLIAPTDISEFRTVHQLRYLGNRKELSLLKKGDVLFGAEGFCKGRVLILADEVQKTISNIHAIIFHPRDGNMIKGIFLGCFLGYLRSIGLVDAIGAGGSGGSLAIGYFGHVPFPKFPDRKQEQIARLYSNTTPPPKEKPTLDTFVDWHRAWNANLGIWELDREMKNLQRILINIQERILNGDAVEVPY